MKKAKKILSVLLTMIMVSSFTAIGFSESESSWIPLTSESPLELDSQVYIVSEKKTLIHADEAGESALSVKSGKTACIYIPENTTLTVLGADARGTTGAGAGIRVPSDSTLIITGNGKLIAQGGNGAHGADGENGGNGEARINEEDAAQGGNGGNGGNGGGGAGAGIGGIGGEGGIGGIGGTGAYVNNGDPSDGLSGKNGGNGGNGKSGEKMGTVIMDTSITYDLKGGRAGNDGLPGKTGSCDLYDASYTLNDYSYAAGGGAGNGGQGGQAASSIGGGGAGGAGGGAGGGGAAMCNDYTSAPGAGDDPHSDFGSGIGGGYGDNRNQLLGSNMYWDSNVTGVRGGNHGSNGEVGYVGGFENIIYHTHSFSSDWSYDKESHWHKCTMSNCPYRLVYGLSIKDLKADGVNFGTHEWENGVCKECGFDGFIIEGNILREYSGPSVNVIIPDSVTEIAQYAFNSCTALESVAIGKSVNKIDYAAFSECSELKIISVKWDKAEDIITPDSSAFPTESQSEIKLYVPAGTSSLYKSADVWKDFDIIDTIDSIKFDAITRLEAAKSDYISDEAKNTLENMKDFIIAAETEEEINNLLKQANNWASNNDRLLTEAIDDAVKELENIESTLISDNAINTVNTAKIEIVQKTNRNDVSSALENALTEIENHEKELSEAIANAKSILEEAKNGAVSDEAKAAADKAISAIEHATSPITVANEKALGLANISVADNNISEAKETAKSELETAKNNAVSDEAKEAANEAISTVNTAVNGSSILTALETGLNNIAAADKALADAKEEAKSDIDNTLGNEPSIKAKEAGDKAKEDIENAVSINGVENAVEEGIKNIEEGQKICDYCGKEHKNFFDKFICFFIKLFASIKSIFKK